jgi:predicted nucleic acid-binding protein
MKYLVDSSALIRILRRDADPVWDALVHRGLLSVCEPVLAETLLIANRKDYEATEDYIAATYVPVTVPANIWDLTAVIRRELVPHGAHNAPSVADLVIAATAIRMKLTLLHEDGDFETVARFVPELQQRRISAGLN